MLSYNKIVPHAALYVDMTYSYLAQNLWSFFTTKDEAVFQKQLENICLKDPTNQHLLVSACVRAATDLMFQALQWPLGSELIMTGVNIPQMAQIARYNGIVPVPVEVDQDTLGTTLEAVKRVVSPRTKGIMISYIYGAKFDSTEIIDWCHAQGIVVIEDLAESFSEPQLITKPKVDFTLFSFGTIKTCSAFGGAITIIRNQEALYRKMCAIQDTYPFLTKSLLFFSKQNFSYLKRTIKNFVPMLILNNQTVNRLFRWTMTNIFPINYKEFVVGNVRGFNVHENFLETFRLKLPIPVFAMLVLRLSTFEVRKYQEATRRLINAQGVLGERGVQVPGHKVENRTFWLFPIIVPNPELTYKMLNQRGVDAYMGVTQLDIVESPVGSSFTYPTKTLEYFKNILYLPIHQAVPANQIQKICREVIDCIQTIEKMDKIKGRL